MSTLSPGHQRSVDYVRNPVTSDGPDGEIHIRESKGVRGDLLQRKSARCELLQGKLTSLVAVAAGALDRDEFQRQFGQREIRELGHLALNDDGPGFALEGIHAEQDA